MQIFNYLNFTPSATFCIITILGLRSSKKRSLLFVNEHFESKRNDKVALLDSFFVVL